MAVPDAPGRDANDVFLENAHLTYIVPFTTKFNPDKALRQGEGSFESKLVGIELRDQLFFGMRFAQHLLFPHPSYSLSLQMKPSMST